MILDLGAPPGTPPGPSGPPPGPPGPPPGPPEAYKKVTKQVQKSTKIYKNPRIPRESLGNRPNSQGSPLPGPVLPVVKSHAGRGR